MGCELSNTIEQIAQNKYPRVVELNSLYQNLTSPPTEQNNFPKQTLPQQTLPQQTFPQQSLPQQNYIQQSNPQTQPINKASKGEKQNVNPSPINQVQGTKAVRVSQQQKGLANINVTDKKNMNPSGRRGFMPLNINYMESFVDHHLKCEISLSKYARGNYIKRRQILQHNRFEEALGRGYSKDVDVINQLAMKSYFQRLMLEIFQIADKQFFEQGKSYDEVRNKIAERYLFQLYQNKEFVDAGTGKICSFINITQLPMSYTALSSDSALFPVLKFLKQKYPQVADNTTIKFPQVKQKKNDVNLLNNFPSKCYSSVNLINIQTLFSDLKFLIDRSLQEFSDFQKDIKAILGTQAIVDSKVKKVTKNGKQQYSASPVRRIFIKWAQTIFERIPQIMLTEPFLQFIKSKSVISDNFCFKSTVQPTTHAKVIDCLGQLLQVAKYDVSTLLKKKQFGFYIYDLLRCKTKRKTGQQICALIQKMEQTKLTPSGKKFEVIRIKDRFKTPNRDVMVNFRYGDVIVAQAQLCIDTSDVSEKTKKINKFNHYIYQLERGLFGPTCELIMQYEDFQRKDISANLEAEGRVQKREKKYKLDFVKKTNRKCFNNHDMIQLEGNFFMQSSSEEQNQEQLNKFKCDYCSEQSTFDQAYHYCYFCTIAFCTNCADAYSKQNVKQIKLRCNAQNIVLPLKNQSHLNNSMSENPIVIFYLSQSASSIMMKDVMVYITTMIKIQTKKNYSIFSYCCDNQDSISICKKYNIKQFPTTILFSSDKVAQTTLVGSSWNYFIGLVLAQHNLNQKTSKAVQLSCYCKNVMCQIKNQQNQKFFCLICGNVDEDKRDNSRLFQCESGHFTCLSCGFLGDNQPSRYKDNRGKTYLFSNKLQAKLPKCQSGHQTKHLKSMKQAQQLKCFKCNQQFIFNDEFGAGNCQQCKNYCCPKCLCIEESNIKSQQQGDLINHTVEMTAQQGQRCICTRLFKKVYKTRDYTCNLDQNRDESEDKTQQIIESVYLTPPKEWKCIICLRKKTDQQLHLACFRCPGMGQKRTNIQVCMECAIGSELLNNQLEPKITQVQTDFVCMSKHSVVKTRLSYDGQMTYDCRHCQQVYYSFTERYYCKSCKVNFCLKCAQKQLRHTKPPKCLRKCNNDHKLKLVYNTRTLQMCEGCRVTLKKLHFECQEYDQCNFELCLNCAATPPGVDTTNNRLKHLDGQKIKKLMLAIENGYDDYNEYYQHQNEDEAVDNDHEDQQDQQEQQQQDQNEWDDD